MATRKRASDAARGPKDDRGVIAARIVAVGRRSFAANGWGGTTLRAVARDAEVDPSLVHYYFGDKRGLLDACMQPPPGFLESIAAAQATPVRRRGAAMVGALLSNWEDAATADVLQSLILTAAHEPIARQRLQLLLTHGMIGAVAERLDADDRMVRAGLVASQMVGLALLRYVWRIEPLASMDRDDVVAAVGPTIQRYVNGAL